MSDNPLRDALKELCVLLEDRGMDYMLVGGLAVGIWGEPRATVDIDFLIAIGTDEFETLRHSLLESSRFVFIHDKPMVFEKITFLRATLKSNADIAVDFIFADDDFKHEALKRKETVALDDVSVNISTPEDLIILKLLSGREQDRLDANKIIAIQGKNLDNGYLQMWVERFGLELGKEWRNGWER